MKKKLIALMLCMVLVIAAMPSVFAANEFGVTFTGEAEKELVYSTEDQEVTVVINGSKEMDNLGGISLDLPYPEGWAITAITNPEIGFGANDVILSLPDTENTGRVLWDCYGTHGGENVKATNIATVTYKVPGGTAVGTYTLKAENFELTDNLGDIWEDDVTVTFDIVIKDAPVPVTGVEVTPETAELKVGETAQLTATVSPEGADDPTVTWTSSDESVATVDKEGKVTAVGVGTATITATTTDGGFTDTATVTVVPTPVEEVGAEPAEATLFVGDKLTLETSVGPEDATDKSLTFTSSDPAVATVDKDGNITAVAPGEVTITVASASNPEVKATVTVTVFGLVDRPEAATDLVYNGAEQEGVPEGDNYALEGDASATDAGSYSVTATPAEGYVWSDDKSADPMDLDWEIKQAGMDDEEVELAVGESGQLVDEKGITYELDPENEEGIIELDENGKVTGLKEGTAKIIVTSDGSGNYEEGTAVITVNVVRAPATGDNSTLFVIAGVFAVAMLIAYLYTEKKRVQR